MTKDRKARELGNMTLAALGVMLGSIVDTMKAADVPNGVVHVYLDRLECGFSSVLWGDALHIMFELIDVIRANVAVND